MKLIVPHTGRLAVDAHLLQLAEFLGVNCETLLLAKEVSQHAEYLERAAPDQNSCLVVTPKVIRDWVGDDLPPAEIISRIVLHFPYVLMCGVVPSEFDNRLLAAVSGGKLTSVLPISDTGQSYQISSSARDICGFFSGLTFGPVDAANDHTLAIGSDDATLQKLICIDGRPNMVAMRRDKTEILILASEHIADVDAEVGAGPLCSCFSRLIPPAMALRHIFREECWCPSKPHASIIIDDPLLRRNYGYLNFETLLRATERHRFHTTISFIPHNFKRNSPRIIRMFRDNPDRLSICFHGNDHMEAEFATNDSALLNAMLDIAEKRMNSHEKVNNLYCDKVMVFPQDKYSVEALSVLKSRNFHGAVSSPYAVGRPVPLTIADMAQPAVIGYGGVPIFTRSFIRHAPSQEIAFSLFFGKPILIGEHHDIFDQPSSLFELVERVNSMVPGISWCNLENAVDNATLRRRSPDGSMQIKPYSSQVRIANDSPFPERYIVEWSRSGQYFPIEGVLEDGTVSQCFTVSDSKIRLQAELPAGASRTFSVLYRNDRPAPRKLGAMWDARAYLRRRLSEVRDNYLSKNRHVLSAAKAIRRHLLPTGRNVESTLKYGQS